MGIIRSGFLILVALLAIISIFMGSLSLIISLSLNYENVQSEMPSLIRDLEKGILDETQGKLLGIFGEFDFLDFDLSGKTNEIIEIMPEHCQEYDDYIFTYKDHVIVLLCSTFEEFGEEGSMNESVTSFAESVYYKDYGCNYWNCFKTLNSGVPFFLVSENAKDYWQGKFYFFLLIFLISIFLAFILLEQKQNTLIFSGFFMAFSVLPLLKIESLTASVTGKILSPFIRMNFIKAGPVFWTVFVLGILLILGGIILRLYTSDLIKKKFSLSEIREMIKSESKKKSKNKETDKKEKEKV